MGRWRRRNCYEFDPKNGWLKLRVYRDMTLSDLVMHFRLKDRTVIERANPKIQGGYLVSREWYWIPTDHLRPSRYKVNSGDTNFTISNRYKLPTEYTIRAWNCLPSSKVEKGDRLLLFSKKDE